MQIWSIYGILLVNECRGTLGTGVNETYFALFSMGAHLTGITPNASIEEGCKYVYCYLLWLFRDQMGRVKRIWYLSPMRAAKVQASLRIRAVSPEPPLLVHTSIELRGTFRQKARSLAPLNGWACAVKMCHDGMLEDTNSLDEAQILFASLSQPFWRFLPLRDKTSFSKIRIEPWYDKTNKVTVRPAKTQIRLGIRPVWSESSLCAQWVAKDPSYLHADSEDADQTRRMPRMIWVFTGRTHILLVLSCRDSITELFVSMILDLGLGKVNLYRSGSVKR